MPAGEPLSPRQRAALQRSLDEAEAACGLRFTVHVGPVEGGRPAAQRLLAASGPSWDSTVLVAVDPSRRSLDIVTGPQAARAVSDRTCGLAALAMTSSFAADDLVGGLVSGIRLLAEHARPAAPLHLDTA